MRPALKKKTPYRNAQGSATLSTAGGVLFLGDPDGNVLAVDARTGNDLWRWQTGYGADEPVMTCELDGQQYVAMATGGISLAMGDQNGDADFTGTPVATTSARTLDFSPDPRRDLAAREQACVHPLARLEASPSPAA